ncbi:MULTISPECIES: hypothetical protein [unclassified Streptomyces]|uniref:hypothetical protein n=1 Tax=unclassified Streptomyces TaxID=2593676 RepID=UPI003D91B5B4
MGFTPNTAARSLRTNSSFTVGVLMPDLTNPLFPQMARGIEAALMPRGYTALLAHTDCDEVKERHQLDVLQGRQADGFIVATARRKHPLLEEARKSGVPIVLLNRCTDRTLSAGVAGQRRRRAEIRGGKWIDAQRGPTETAGSGAELSRSAISGGR